MFKKGVLIVWIIFLILAYCLPKFLLNTNQELSFIYSFGLSWSGFIQGGIWQLLSHAVLHAGIWHLVTNLLLLGYLGWRLLPILSLRLCTSLLLAGIICGGGLHLLISKWMLLAGYDDKILIGISGGCYALLIALTTLSPSTRILPIPLSGRSLGLGIIITECIFILIHPSLGIPLLSRAGALMMDSGLGDLFRISHACHLGGALAGFYIGKRYLARPVSLEELQRQRAKFEN
ncbi:MAG: rhomboid family intramembrane serine protease [Akkermansiaceae bacterium]